MTDQGKNQYHDQETHEYDGIIEHDNMLPKWWLGTFYIAIVFAAFYVGYYFVGDGPTLREEWSKDKTALELQVAAQGNAAQVSLAAAVEQAIGAGEQARRGDALFQVRCASCHGKKGEGGIGPNLTDAYWLHGAKPIEIAQTITQGVQDKGMPPWGGAMSPVEIAAATSYIVSLKGTNPPGAKTPQGTFVQ